MSPIPLSTIYCLLKIGKIFITLLSCMHDCWEGVLISFAYANEFTEEFTLDLVASIGLQVLIWSKNIFMKIF